MYFLNGDRIYIKPDNTTESLHNQLLSCVGQLNQINSGKKVFKVNFFADTSNNNSYSNLQEKAHELISERFTTPVVVNIIAQPPLTCKILAEVFYFDATLWNSKYIQKGNGAAMLFEREGTEILIGNVQANKSKSCHENAANTFEGFGGLLGHAGFPVNSIIRQWNYLEDILGFDDDKQRYQEFNNVRSDFYAHHFKETGYPAATGIGMNRGGVLIEFVALKSESAHTMPLDNPGQVAAHVYSDKVLIGGKFAVKTTPKFERARYLGVFGKKMIFISGTASIRGEETIGLGDAAKQAEVTIENIRRLYSDEVLSQIPDNGIRPQYGHTRVYVKHRKDFKSIKNTVERYFGNLSAVFILADICRDDLLVEIEGKVVLE